MHNKNSSLVYISLIFVAIILFCIFGKDAPSSGSEKYGNNRISGDSIDWGTYTEPVDIIRNKYGNNRI